MKQKLTMKEFELMCKNELSKKKIMFKSESQPWDDIYNSLKFNLVFNKIFVYIAPNKIYFANDDNKMTLIYVKYIYIDTYKYNNNIDFTVVCGEDDDVRNTEYNFLAS